MRHGYEDLILVDDFSRADKAPTWKASSLRSRWKGRLSSNGCTSISRSSGVSSIWEQNGHDGVQLCYSCASNLSIPKKSGIIVQSITSRWSMLLLRLPMGRGARYDDREDLISY